jgi:hypothetical protein
MRRGHAWTVVSTYGNRYQGTRYVQAIDSSSKTTGQAAAISAAGYEAVGIYLRSDRCSQGMLQELHNQGLKVWSVWEKGYPTTDGYFTAAKGTADGTAAAAFASLMQQPQGTQIFAAVDYDASITAVNGPITGYMTAFKVAVMAAGYVTSVGVRWL